MFKSEFLIQDLISRLIMNENGISINQNLSLDVGKQKQIKFWKLKMSLLFNGWLRSIQPLYEISKISDICSIFRKSVCIRVIHIF